MTVDRVLALDSPIRRYAWGSVDFIPSMVGLPVTGEPAAELWMGAHPAAPCLVAGTGESLATVIAADPKATLGAACLDRFGEKLPFLLKVLAAAAPLSIQVHPNLAQARAGFAEEDARGVPIGAPNRNYADPNHKPELICALTDLDALCGFRPVDDSARLLRALIDVGALGLTGYPERLQAPGGLREVVTALLSLTARHRAQLHESVLPACATVESSRSEWSMESAWIGRLAQAYPNGAGVILALLMNLVRLAPGEALFLSAGRIHAYLRGAGVEIMAASDNVVRCGLTPKHVDVPELLRVLDFDTEDARPLRPQPTMNGVRRYPTSVLDFVLNEVRLADGEFVLVAAEGPQILLCTEGEVAVAVESGDGKDLRLAIARGHAVFVAAGTPVSIAGDGQLFLASTNL